MDVKKSLIAIALLGLIAGCNDNTYDSSYGGTGTGTDTGAGGNDNNNNNDNNEVLPAPPFNVRVVDGYLLKAEVYVDRNNNNVADKDEKLAKITDAKGYVLVPGSDKDFNLIARAVEGQTTDTDTAGPIQRSFELTAAAGSTIVNPYTTLALIENKSIDQLALELELDSALIAGDYVAAKNDVDADAAQAAKKAHLIARSLTLTLKNDLLQSMASADEIKAELDVIKNKVNELDNDPELENIDDIIIKNGEKTDLVKTTNALFDGKIYYLTSLNLNEYQAQASPRITFEESQAVIKFESEGNSRPPVHTTYTTDGFIFTPNSEQMHQGNIIFFADNFYLVVTEQDKLNLLAELSSLPSKNIQDVQFEGKTIYTILDQSETADVIPVLTKMTFQDNMVISEQYDVDEGFQPLDASWSWTVSEDTLVIHADETDINWTFTPLENLGVQIVYNQDNKTPAVFTEREDMAVALYEHWLTIRADK